MEIDDPSSSFQRSWWIGGSIEKLMIRIRAVSNTENFKIAFDSIKNNSFPYRSQNIYLICLRKEMEIEIWSRKKANRVHCPIYDFYWAYFRISSLVTDMLNHPEKENAAEIVEILTIDLITTQHSTLYH